MLQLDGTMRPSYEQVLGSVYWIKLVPFEDAEIEAIKAAVTCVGVSNPARLLKKVKDVLRYYRTAELIAEYGRYQLPVDLISRGMRLESELVERRIRLFDALKSLGSHLDKDRRGVAAVLDAHMSPEVVAGLIGGPWMDGWMLSGIIKWVNAKGLKEVAKLAKPNVMEALLGEHQNSFLSVPLTNLVTLLEDVVRVCDLTKFRFELLMTKFECLFSYF
jgi:hypothetical protein